MKILSQRRVEITTYWTREFDQKQGHGSGFGFPCAENGAIYFDELAPAAINSLAFVTANPDYIDRGAIEHTRQTTHPAIGQCDGCMRTVVLDSGTNGCQCGLEYNSFGQRLAPRDQWGEETNEHPSDVARWTS
jgi:hypothetical protein